MRGNRVGLLTFVCYGSDYKAILIGQNFSVSLFITKLDDLTSSSWCGRWTPYGLLIFVFMDVIVWYRSSLSVMFLIGLPIT